MKFNNLRVSFYLFVFYLYKINKNHAMLCIQIRKLIVETESDLDTVKRGKGKKIGKKGSSGSFPKSRKQNTKTDTSSKSRDSTQWHDYDKGKVCPALYPHLKVECHC